MKKDIQNVITDKANKLFQLNNERVIRALDEKGFARVVTSSDKRNALVLGLIEGYNIGYAIATNKDCRFKPIEVAEKKQDWSIIDEYGEAVMRIRATLTDIEKIEKVLAHLTDEFRIVAFEQLDAIEI